MILNEVTFRKSKSKDSPYITQLLKDLDFYKPGLDYSLFWIAEADKKIVGILELEEYANFKFLSYVGVQPTWRKKGIAKSLIKYVANSCDKPVYLYTVIPEFYLKLGFRVIPPIADLPAKDPMECSQCEPNKCVCMVVEP
ncbi:GNAT family N-acetyltransferase [Thermoproteota archaeon]